jgi:hypothetical protein
LDVTEGTFKRALTVAALARAFNGVISVAQGTEVTIQPVGVGVTLTLGEILDPINDLVERFSLLALVASVSLDMQLTLGEIFASTWFAGAVTIAVAWTIFFVWRPAKNPATKFCQRAFLAFICVRFIFVAVLSLGYLANTAFLEDQQTQAMDHLAATTTQVQTLQSVQNPTQADEEAGFIDRTAAGLSNLLNATRQSLDLKAQLKQVREAVEKSVEEIISLIVVFILQTLLIPIGSLYLVWWSIKTFGRRLNPNNP